MMRFGVVGSDAKGSSSTAAGAALRSDALATDHPEKPSAAPYEPNESLAVFSLVGAGASYTGSALAGS
jgi:hypothetical protein